MGSVAGTERIDVEADLTAAVQGSGTVLSSSPPVGTIENGVLIGHDGVLFLAGGGHTVFDIVTGRRAIPEHSFEVFSDNIATRAAWAKENGAKYLHLIFPDKQSIIPEHWPIGVPLRIGEQYVKRVPASEQTILYPVELLATHQADVISKVDTHVSAYGSILVAAEIVRRLTGQTQDAIMRRLLESLVPGPPHSGDLGSKLQPPVTAVEPISSAMLPGRWLHNGLPGGNNGMIDIRLCTTPAYDQRLVLFGDSFGRDVCRFLQSWFREVVFLRTGFFDPDLAKLLKPDILITENVERYLDICQPDAARPNFFMYPHLAGLPYAPSQEFAETFSALLSVGRPPYQAFYLNAFKAPPALPNTPVPAIPEAFRAGTLRLVDWPVADDDVTPIEAPRTVPRHMPEFWLDLSGRGIANALWAQQEVHGSNLVRRQDVLVFGANLQVDVSGRWACESRSFTQQFLDAYATPNFQHMFTGPKPRLVIENGANWLDFDGLDPAAIEYVEEPIFLATPLEPLNWGRWVVTVLPKLAQFREYGQGRKLFCYSERAWQRALLARFGLSSIEIINHNPARSYFCKDVMTVDYSITNMTVSAGERALLAGVREQALQTMAARQGKRAGKRLFVSRMSGSRRHPNYRVLQNERELAAALSLLGFDTIEPETLDFDDQVATFANAEVVVCLGGAALYNAAFCRPEAIVITIESSASFLGPHTDLLGSLQLRYGVIIGKQDPTDQTPVHKRWTVDIAAVCDQVSQYISE